MSYRRLDEVLLTVDHVSMSYGAKVVLRDVCATIKDIEDHGQVICFLGPSGIGKTQLSRIMAGLQVPTSGRVLLRNDHVVGAGYVGMVPQDYPMFDYATLAGNLAIAGKQAGLSKTEINIRATELINEFGLQDHLAKYPKELSGGTKQRVAIARQLMCATNYMVMDEPFSGLDPIMKGRAAEAIVKYAARDTYNTAVIVTHDVTQGLIVADTVWMMGYERDETGTTIPGARLVEQFDLAEMGFAWRDDLDHDPAFLAFGRQVKDRFNTLR